MSVPIIPDRESVAAIEQRLCEHDATVAAAAAALEGLHGRRAALRVRLDRLKNAAPAGVSEAVSSDALAGDPDCKLDAATLAEAAKRRASARKADEGREAEVSIVEQALHKLDGEIDKAEVALAQLRGDRDGPWGDFVRAAHAHLVDQFVTAFKRLRHELVEPIVSLARVKGADGRTLVPIGDVTIDFDRTTVVLTQFGAGRFNTAQLYPLDRNRLFSDPAPIARLRSGLSGADGALDEDHFRSRAAGDLPIIRETQVRSAPNRDAMSLNIQPIDATPKKPVTQHPGW